MVLSVNLGFPRMGENRELKKLVENYWSSKINATALLEGAKSLRQAFWLKQKQSGIDLIPSNDFSLYDQVLDHIYMFGAIPKKYADHLGLPDNTNKKVDENLRLYFAMPRGIQTYKRDQPNVVDVDLPAMEMKKWFDTNYHFIVPEFSASTTFKLSSTKVIDEFLEAKALGITTKPVLLGPITFLLSGKSHDEGFDSFSLLSKLLPVYENLLQQLQDTGAEWVQLDEPFLVCDLPKQLRSSFRTAYERLAAAAPRLKIFLATYFGGIDPNLELIDGLPIAALHVDLVRDPNQFNKVLPFAAKNGWHLSLGVIDGRNIWIGDLNNAKRLIEESVKVLGNDRVLVGPSCSLLHVPYSLDKERGQDATIDPEILEWMSFASEKLLELNTLVRAVNNAGKVDADVQKVLDTNKALVEKHKVSPRIHSPEVQQALGKITADMRSQRKTPASQRLTVQKKKLNLPILPTTTIGSFPQTQEVRAKRAELQKKAITKEEYESFIRQQIKHCIEKQEQLGLDVLVHGESERNDMVEYFGEHMRGYTFSKNGWVQSYGSRCVKPPIIYGDIDRPSPITVDYIKYAQSVASKPVKGMLTGPTTMLQWSFVRTDQPRKLTTEQLALAIRKEVLDLEKAGIPVIQIDEPAIREGLPLRHSEWDAYLQWSVDCFLIASSGVRDDTQIHTHMCYSDFNDIMSSIARMDADVILIEYSKSDQKLLKTFQTFKYPNDIGPGLYDIHSPRVPSTEEMEQRLKEILQYFPATQVWVNPDCGLKSRGWKETEGALQNLTRVAQKVRQGL